MLQYAGRDGIRFMWCRDLISQDVIWQCIKQSEQLIILPVCQMTKYFSNPGSFAWSIALEIRSLHHMILFIVYHYTPTFEHVSTGTSRYFSLKIVIIIMGHWFAKRHLWCVRDSDKMALSLEMETRRIWQNWDNQRAYIELPFSV